jgi:hypothetical protein
MDRATAAVMVQAKSVGLAFVLTLLFGGLGLFYASIVGGIVISILELLAVIVAFLTLGIGGVLIPVLHVVAVIWAIIATQQHNGKLLARL